MSQTLQLFPVNSTLQLQIASGARGRAATVDVGATTTLAEGTSATASNSGDENDAVFDFGIPRGAVPAVGWNFDTSTTDADPGNGDVRFNNATPASVTAIYFDNLDRDGNTVTSWLDAFDDSTATVKGYLVITPAATPTAKLIYSVSGSVVDGTGYRKVTVSHVSGTALPSSTAHLAFSFSRTGNNGTNGTNGTDGEMAGPATSTDNAVPRFDGTDGTTVQNSGVIIDDSDNVQALSFKSIRTTGNISYGMTGDIAEGRWGFGLNGSYKLGVYNDYATGAIAGAATPSYNSETFYAKALFGKDGSLQIGGALSVGDAATTFSNIKQAATTSATGVVELATNAETQTGTDTVRAVTSAGVAAATIMQGKHTIWIPAIAMVSRTTNGAAAGTAETSSNKNMLKTLDFDTTTQEFAQFTIAMPKSWNEGTVTFQPVWSHAATVTNFGVVWALQGVATSDDDAMDAAFGTEQTSTDTGGTTDDRYVGPESAAITIAGSPAANDIVQFQVKRVPSDGNDTLGIDARLHGVKLYITLDAATDA